MNLFGPPTTEGRVPPQDLPAEQAVLGSILLEPGAAERALAILDDGDFYREHHRVIYAAMQSIAARREPVDLITVSAELRAMGALEEIGGSEYLTALIGEVPTAAHVSRYAKIVWERAMLRRVISRGMEAAAAAYDNPESVQDFLCGVATQFGELAEAQCGGGAGPLDVRQTPDQLRDEFHGYLHLLEDAEGRPRFGLARLDRDLGNLPWGSLVTVLGFPGFGKTTLAAQAAYQEAMVCRRGAAVFCGEMPREELLSKLVEMHTNGMVKLTPFEVRRGGQALKDDALLALEDIQRANLHIQGSERPFRYKDIRAHIRRLARTENVRLFVVDSFGNLVGESESDTVIKAKVYAYGLKALMGELRAVGIATCQVTQGLGGETWTQWGREVEQQAHISLRLVGSKPGTIEEQRADPEVVAVLRKVRIGEATGRRYKLLRHGGRFTEISERDDAPPEGKSAHRGPVLHEPRRDARDGDLNDE